MSDGAQFSVGALTAGAVLLSIIAASLYGCERANRSYYDMARQCTEQGGSFVPVSNGGYSAICIGSKSEKR